MSYNIPGDLLIILATAMNVVAGIAFLMAGRGRLEYENLAKKAYKLFALFTGLAVVYLLYLFFSHNYSIKYVYEYSQSSQSFFYILAAFWGGQEGTYLLWLFYISLFGFIIIRYGGEFRNYAMFVYSLVVMFLLVILINLSPYALLPFQATDGVGLNPLLKDPWMVIHPPIMFSGYAMTAVPFAIAGGALLLKKYDGWLKLTLPWVVLITLALAAGNILGGYWAYKTLGWGGYWGWDPVENSSMVPWLFSLGLLHGMLLERKTGSFRRTNFLLAGIVFLLVVYGTFLTRSGVLADFSVHSFTSLGINNYLIGFMAFFFLLVVGLILYRFNFLAGKPYVYDYYRKDFSIFLGMVVFVIFGAIVLFWSSLPLLTSLVGMEPRAADIGTYNNFALPLAIIMAFLLSFSPILNSHKTNDTTWKGHLLIALLVSAALGFGLFHFVLGASFKFAVVFVLVITGMIMYLRNFDILQKAMVPLVGFVLAILISIISGVDNYMYILFFAAGAMAVICNLNVIIKVLPIRPRSAGAHLAHFGYGIMIVGILASSAFTSSEKVIIPRNDTRDAFGTSIRYTGMDNQITSPENRLNLYLKSHGSEKLAKPHFYFSERMGGLMKKPYIDRRLTHDLYIAPEQIQENPNSQGLVLTKDEPQKVGDYTFIFKEFQIGSHGDNPEGKMQVSAIIDVVKGSDTTVIKPQQVHGLNDGMSVREPAMIQDGDREIPVYLEQIQADLGQVVLEVPDLLETAPPDKVVLDISKKPLINFVWIGTTLILLGVLIVFVRRRSDLTQSDRE